MYLVHHAVGAGAQDAEVVKVLVDIPHGLAHLLAVLLRRHGGADRRENVGCKERVSGGGQVVVILAARSSVRGRWGREEGGREKDTALLS